MGRAADSPLRRGVALILIVIAILVLAPYVIAPFYRFVNPVSMPMLWRYATGAPVDRHWVPLNQISPALPLAVIIAEDGTFCVNRGIDLGAMREALRQSGDVGESRGASTITQQTVKNLFLWQGRSYVRKALEIPLAIWLNLVLPKRRVMEIYLNIVEWGPNAEFGAEAGSRFAFGKSARDLTPYEAAELASILPNPYRRSARTPRFPGAPAGRPLRAPIRGVSRARGLRQRPIKAVLGPSITRPVLL